MKINLLKYIFALGMLLGLAACSGDDIPLPDGPKGDEFARVEGDKVVVNIGIDAPDLQEVSSRALDATPDYNDMHLYLVEFDDNGSPLLNTLKTVYTPDEETPAADRVNYTVTLNKSNQPRILHLIALPKNQELDLTYGVEAQIIPSLKTSGDTPAYWRRLTFPLGYIDEAGTIAEELDQLRHVALIRNHACITMTNSAQGFMLKGFAIVNCPTEGTIAPWNASKNQFPEFLNIGQGPLDFTDVSASYPGVIPPNLTLANPETAPVVTDNTNPKYLYERPFNSIRHTYVIIKGRRAQDDADSYYKLDIGKKDADGIFQYYGILRNYRYNIRLNSVDTKGYKSAKDAASGVVYNNFSFDVEMSSMLNISDGNEVVFVNFTTKILTNHVPDPDGLEFKFRYQNLSTGKYDNSNASIKGLVKGDVIQDYQILGDGADGWRTVKIYYNPAETETKIQTLTIVKPSGLGRTVNLILHAPWELKKAKAFGGTWENWYDNTPDDGTVGPAKGDDLTIFFDIPDNLDEAMFPLEFILEADHQNIENNPLGKLVVTSDVSGFSGVTGRRIKYIKSVTWAQYLEELNENDRNDNGTAIDNGDGTFTHRVRCRFRTTTALDKLSFDQSVTQVLITNEHFNDKIVTFTRHS